MTVYGKSPSIIPTQELSGRAADCQTKAMNEVAKTRIALEVKDLKERSDTISKIMGAVLEDMTKSSSIIPTQELSGRAAVRQTSDRGLLGPTSMAFQ